MMPPPRRITAASWPPSGRRLPATAMFTGTERAAMPVRVKFSMLSRASARGAGGDDSAALLNNAGFAALLRGDYEKAMTLLDEAGQARGAFYPLASENRKLAVSLKTQAGREVHDGN